MLSKASAKRPATAPLPSNCFHMRSKTFILDILALLPRNLLFLFIRLSFIHKTQALSSLFSICQVKKLACFMSHNSTRFHRTFHFQILFKNKKKLQAKVLNSTCQISLIGELLQILNFVGLTALTAFILFNQSDRLL